MKYRFIMENLKRFRIGKMCEVLEVSRSGYHKYIKGRLSQRKIENMKIVERIKKIYENVRGRYGSRRIHAELRAMGIKCNKKRVERLMRINGIKAKTKRKYKATTDSNHRHKVAENLLDQNFQVEEANKVWVSDITYIGTEEGWLYLAIIMDLYSRKIVGWGMSDRLTNDLIEAALNQAIMRRNPQPGLIFHSDRGSQYSSDKVGKILRKNNFLQSMSGKGNCYDNAVAESFFHTLKAELVSFERYQTRSAARSSIFEYIEVFYNNTRRHSTLNYYSPMEYENKLYNLVA